MKLGKNIQQLRKAHGYTQTELADKLGVSEQTISKWENDKCYPDISLLPMLAEIFNCSVDAVLDIDSNTYGVGLEETLQKYSNANDYNEEIEILLEGLSKYPRNNELKLNLANSYFMAWRSAESKEEKEVFFSKAVNYCYDTIYNQKNDEEFDRANILLMHIYTEDGNYKKALQACKSLTIDSWRSRIVGTAQILKESKSGEFAEYAQNSLFELHNAIRFVCHLYCNDLIEKKNYEKAIAFCELQKRILSLFDTGGSELYLNEKMILAFQIADIYKKTAEADKVYENLFEMSGFAKKQITKGYNHSFSENPLLHLVKEPEPSMSEVQVKQFVNSFLDKFSGGLDDKKISKLKIS